MSLISRWLLGWLLLFPVVAVAAPPTCADPRLVIELVVKEPEIVTPTGITVDEQGRVWVIENHTHQRSPSYQGPATDRIRVFADFDTDGKPRKVHTFAEGFRDSMSLALGRNGAVYFATRSTVYLLKDTKGNGVADEKRVLVKLESKGDYPHNGVSGFAIDALDNVYFSLGENLGASYKLIGSDGSTESGGGEGGSIYRCRPDGSKLVRVATGFWNTFHIAFDAFGRLFAVDNDPDSRGPCRLLHIVQGGDYGYRYRNGRKGLHPFTAWNGELPGTLPMVAGTAEAPSGILAYESNGLPEEYRGCLLSTSWGDHVVERFTLTPRGASFQAKQQTLIRGGEDFRPVGIAVGPDGNIYLSDWMSKSYPVHGNGRIWRIRMKQPPKDDGLRASQVAGLDARKLAVLLGHPKREIRAAAGAALAGKEDASLALQTAMRDKQDPRKRMHALWSAARRTEATEELVSEGLKDAAPEIRAEAVRLLGERLPAQAERRDESRFLKLATHDPSASVRMQALTQLRQPASWRELVPTLADKDPYLAGAALAQLGRPGNTELLLAHAKAVNPALRVGVLLALRRAGEEKGRETLRDFLADADPDVRRAAIQWVGEERLREFAPQLSGALSRPPVTRELFEAYLATLELLDNKKRKPGDEPSGEQYIAVLLQDDKQSSAIHAVALRMLRPNHPALSAVRLRRFLDSNDADLRRQATLTLALRSDAASQEQLARLAKDTGADASLRAEAVAGLAHSAAAPATERLLVGLLDEPALRRAALRSLREQAQRPEGEQALWSWWTKIEAGMAATERSETAAQLGLALRGSKQPEAEKRRAALLEASGQRPALEAQWKDWLKGKGDPRVGARIFFHRNGPRCYTCHRIDGRGGALGPELSKIARGLGHDKLVESILTPSKEIAPQFVAWSIATRDGKVHNGLIVEEGPHSTITLADAQGKTEVLRRQDIEERHALATSIMPDILAELMTPQEFRDLIAFLNTLK